MDQRQEEEEELQQVGTLNRLRHYLIPSASPGNCPLRPLS